MNPEITKAALGALTEDPAFKARFGGAEVDPPAEAEDLAPETDSQDAPEAEKPETEVAQNPLEDRLSKLEKMAEDRQTFITQLQTENRELRAALTKPSPEPEVDPFTELEQYGVPPETMKKLVLWGVSEGMKAYMEPMVKVAEAEKQLQADPAYVTHAAELETFVRANKEVAEVVIALANAGKVKEAKSYAWREFKLANADRIEAPLREKAEASKAEREAKKKDAGIVKTQKAESRTPKDERADINARNLAAAQSGSKTAMGRYITDALFPKRPQ